MYNLYVIDLYVYIYIIHTHTYIRVYIYIHTYIYIYTHTHTCAAGVDAYFVERANNRFNNIHFIISF